MQQQPIAVNILNGFAETEKRFDVGEMRHLLKYLEEEEFISFLRTHKHTTLSKMYVGAHSMKKIPREIKICLLQNVLNDVNVITKYLKVVLLVFANKSVEWKCVRF